MSVAEHGAIGGPGSRPASRPGSRPSSRERPHFKPVPPEEVIGNSPPLKSNAGSAPSSAPPADDGETIAQKAAQELGAKEKEGAKKYKRLKLLGQGSFGRAYLAKDLANGEECVLKQVKLAKMDAKAQDTAVREAYALRRMAHPNIVRFREVFAKSGWLCLVMDFADGGDLSAVVKDRAKMEMPLEESRLLECFVQIADGLRYCHNQKMIHRDVKSKNVFLCRSGRALLGDFGLVRVLDSTTELASSRVGTPYYLSPEIIKKQPYSFETDVWSLGVLLYEMITLKRPFMGTLQTLPRKILEGQYAPIPDTYSEAIRGTVGSMLQVDPKRRATLHQILEGDLLGPCLQYVREALGLQAPELPQKKKSLADRLRSGVAKGADEMAATWIGFETMCRRPKGWVDPHSAVPVAAPSVASVGPNAVPKATPVGDEEEVCSDEDDDWKDAKAVPIGQDFQAPVVEISPIDEDGEELADESVPSEDSWGEIVEANVMSC